MNITEKEYRRIYKKAYITSHLKDEPARDRMFAELMAEATNKARPTVAPHDCKRVQGTRQIDGSRVKVEVRK